MRSQKMNQRYASVLTCALALTVWSSVSRAAHLEYVAGNFGGQLGGGVVMAGHENAGFVDHWDADLPSDGYASNYERITAGSTLAGWAHLDLNQGGRVTATGSNIDIMLHSMLDAQASSAGGTLRYWQIAARNPITDPFWVAHADSHVQDLTYRIVPDAGESIGDAVSIRIDGSLSVTHLINAVGYSSPHDLAAYHVSGQLDGGYPNPFTFYRKAFNGVTFAPLVQADGWPDCTRTVFSHEYRTVTIGDEIMVRGGVQPYLNVYHHQEKRGAEVGVFEHVRAEQRLNTSLQLMSTPIPSPIAVAADAFGNGDLAGWTPLAGPGGSVTTGVRPDASGDYGIRLFDPGDDPVRITKQINCESTVRVAFDFFVEVEGQVDLILGGQTLDSFTVVPHSWGEVQRYNQAFDLADFSLSPGDLLLEIKICSGLTPDPDVMLDNITLTTWNIPEPASSLTLVLGGLTCLRRRRR